MAYSVLEAIIWEEPYTNTNVLVNILMQYDMLSN